MSKRSKASGPANPNEAAEDEPTARAYGLWLVPGQGWRTCVLELPQSVVERYAVDVTEPELLGVRMGALMNRIEADALGRHRG